MKKLQIVFLLMMFTISLAINCLRAQDLDDIAFFQSQNLRTKLGLSFDQTQKMEETLKYFGAL